MLSVGKNDESVHDGTVKAPEVATLRALFL